MLQCLWRTDAGFKSISQHTHIFIMNSVKPILNTRVFKLKKNKVKTPQHKNIIFSTHSPHITPKPPEIKNYPEMKESVAGNTENSDIPEMSSCSQKTKYKS